MQEGRFVMDEWNDFSCADFRKIDRLWSEASGGNLGFRAQYEIFESVQGKDTSTKFFMFYDKVKWRDVRTGEWKVSWSPENKTIRYVPKKRPNFLNPSKGHLPAKLSWIDGQEYRFKKVKDCKL